MPTHPCSISFLSFPGWVPSSTGTITYVFFVLTHDPPDTCSSASLVPCLGLGLQAKEEFVLNLLVCLLIVIVMTQSSLPLWNGSVMCSSIYIQNDKVKVAVEKRHSDIEDTLICCEVSFKPSSGSVKGIIAKPSGAGASQKLRLGKGRPLLSPLHLPFRAQPVRQIRGKRRAVNIEACMPFLPLL